MTNQRETTVVWDKVTGQPLYNAIGGLLKIKKTIKYSNFSLCFIVWNDIRTDVTVDKILARIPDQNKDYFKSISGNQ